MVKNIKPLLPDESRCIYSEGIDYSQTGKETIWGTEDPAMVRILAECKIGGEWLNFCAGDGRFNDKLLSIADSVTATDIDPGALDKLTRNTDPKLATKLRVITCNATEALPFGDSNFDGIFCTGTLHLFPKDIFLRIKKELERILKPDGTMLFDFSTDIKRIREDGSLYTVAGEPLYTMSEATALLQEAFLDYELYLESDSVEPEAVHVRGEKYYFSANYLAVRALPKD